MDTGDSSSLTPLYDTGVDFSNETQAMDFLGAILDDTELQVIGNQYAREFWYGIVVVIGIAALFNIFQTATLKMRYVPFELSKTSKWHPTIARHRPRWSGSFTDLLK